MTSLEYCYWEALDRIQPVTAIQAIEYCGAQIERTLVNINRDHDTHPMPFRLADFLLFHEPTDPEEASEQAIADAFLALFPMNQDPETRH